jgi:hypothetical protein
MNANELADELENRHKWKLLNHIHWSEQAATMLRQQQAEIEALKTENSHLKYEISSGAWNSRELTDQEIFNIYAYQQDTYAGDNFPVAVGRAILRKAQEK